MQCHKKQQIPTQGYECHCIFLPKSKLMYNTKNTISAHLPLSHLYSIMCFAVAYKNI